MTRRQWLLKLAIEVMGHAKQRGKASNPLFVPETWCKGILSPTSRGPDLVQICPRHVPRQNGRMDQDTVEDAK